MKFLLERSPPKLLLVSTGNISNPALERLLLSNLDALITALAEADYVELGRSSIIVHE